MVIPAEQCLIFSLHHQVYAMDLNLVIRVISSQTVTLNTTVEGLLYGTQNNQKGVFPIVDLRQYLGLPEVGLDPQRQVLVTQIRNNTVGWLVDRVVGVYGLNTQEAHCALLLQPGTVLKTQLGNALVLDLERMFTRDQQKIIEQIGKRHTHG